MNEAINSLWERVFYDSANDGIEVEIIRREMEISHRIKLYWSDPVTGRVLSRPMNIYEIIEGGRHA